MGSSDAPPMLSWSAIQGPHFKVESDQSGIHFVWLVAKVSDQTDAKAIQCLRPRSVELLLLARGH